MGQSGFWQIIQGLCSCRAATAYPGAPGRSSRARSSRPSLAVIGVHTPEFPFEYDIENVRRAVRQMGIEYPIAIDNEYFIWRAFRPSGHSESACSRLDRS